MIEIRLRYILCAGMKRAHGWPADTRGACQIKSDPSPMKPHETPTGLDYPRLYPPTSRHFQPRLHCRAQAARPPIRSFPCPVRRPGRTIPRGATPDPASLHRLVQRIAAAYEPMIWARALGTRGTLFWTPTDKKTTEDHSPPYQSTSSRTNRREPSRHSSTPPSHSGHKSRLMLRPPVKLGAQLRYTPPLRLLRLLQRLCVPLGGGMGGGCEI